MMSRFAMMRDIWILLMLPLVWKKCEASGAAAEGSKNDRIAPGARDEPSFPDVWTAIEDSFETDILMTIPEAFPNGVSMFVEEMFAEKLDIGCVRVVDHGQYSRYNYYSASSQMFYVKNQECLVGGLFEYPGYHFYGWTYDMQQGPGTDSFVFGPSAMLRAARDHQPKYVGSETVRGIDGDTWNLIMDESYNITYTFPTEAWNMPYWNEVQGKEFRPPLQITATGMQKDPWDQTEKLLTVYYDYIIFNPFVTPENSKSFLVQKGVDCEGRKTLDQTKTQHPLMPRSFLTHMEFIQRGVESQAIYRAWMYYDERRNMVRLDLNLSDEPMMNLYTRLIFDYDTGVVYIIDDNTGECMMKSIHAGDFGGTGVSGAVMMADPSHIFRMDDSLIFTGYSETRGLLTERWTTTSDDIPNQNTGENYKKVVIDYQFLQADVLDVGEPDTYQSLVRMDMTVYDDNNLTVVAFHEAINFLDFVGYDQNFLMDEFDVRECFQLPQQRSWLKITFQGIWEEGLSEHVFDFQKDLIRRFNEGANVSYARMPEIQVDHDDDFVWAILLLLQPAPYLLEFTKEDNPRKPNTQSTQITPEINDANICAGYCLAYTGFECHSFFECTGQGRNCFLSDKTDATGDVILDQECDYYVAPVDHLHKPQFPNFEVENWLTEQIVDGLLRFSYPYTDQNNVERQGNYTGLRYIRELLADDPLFVDYLREDFMPLQYGARIKDQDTQLKLNSMSYAKCLETCEFYEAFRCETFSYCYSEGTCYLSATMFVKPMHVDEMVLQADCNIITRQLIDDYTRVDGTILNAEVNQQTCGIVDANYCAFLCDKAEGFICRSFDFCMDTDCCLLHDTHSLDTGGDALQHNYTHCTHYSRDYLVDFEEHENVRISGTRDVFIEDIPVEQCARECVSLPGQECDGFDYCTENNINTCFLTQYSYTGDGVPVTDTLTCDHYKRVYYEGKDVNTVANTKNDNKYGSGDMVGLAFGVLVSTIALCLLGFYVYNR